MNNVTTRNPQIVSTGAKRFGCYPARIGSTHAHRLANHLTLPSGRYLKAGTIVHLDVQDTTRHPEAAKLAKWVCSSPLCREIGKSVFASKAELLAAHADQRVLAKQEEQHLFMAVAELPGSDAVDEKKGKTGHIEVEYQAAKLPSVMLLSDEE